MPKWGVDHPIKKRVELYLWAFMNCCRVKFTIFTKKIRDIFVYTLVTRVWIKLGIILKLNMYVNWYISNLGIVFIVT